MNIAINGFGRIGRTFLRAFLRNQNATRTMNIVAINIGPEDPALVAYLFQYDSVMGTYGDYTNPVVYQDGYLIINEQRIRIVAEKEASKLPWSELAIEWVVECSGKYTHREKAEEHLHAGARRVLISAPATGADVSIILGVNDHAYNSAQHALVSLGSCTTNATMPLLALIDEMWGIEAASVVTTHAYTPSQVLLDGFIPEAKDIRSSRAAGLNIIPSKTGLSRMVGEIFPHLADRVTASSLRVPVPKVSLVEITWTSRQTPQKDEINAAMREASNRLNTRWHVFEYINVPLVSSDFAGNDYSVVYDALLTQSVGTMGKVSGWYDNEWAYSNRLVDFLLQ